MVFYLAWQVCCVFGRPFGFGSFCSFCSQQRVGKGVGKAVPRHFLAWSRVRYKYKRWGLDRDREGEMETI